MKKLISRITLLCVILSCVCAFNAAAKEKFSITTKVVSVDNHGNAILAVKGSTFSARGFSVSDMVSINVGAFKCVAPIVQNYSDVENGEYLLRIKGNEVSLAINMGNFCKASGAKEGSQVTIGMKERYGYLTAYHIRMLKSTENREDYESDEVFANFREVKIGKIAEGRLYRTGNPITPHPRSPYSAKLLEEANVKAILNLHQSEEDAPQWIEEGSFYDTLYKDGKVICLGMGVSFSDLSFIQKLNTALKFIADNKLDSYAIHGKDGKNRTGYVCAILEALCGATMKEITDDYMKSYENYYNVKRNSNQYKELAKSVQYVFQNINNGKNVNDKNLYSVVEKYLIETVGLTAEDIQNIKTNLE